MDYALLGILITVVMEALYLGHKMGVIENKISTLEKKQDKHNNLIERTYNNERDISIIKEKLSVENHRIDDLEDIQHEYINKRNWVNKTIWRL